MGGPGSGRLPNPENLIRTQPLMPIADELFLPNYSGLKTGTKKQDPDVFGVPSGVIVMWSGAISAIPSGWVLCNGSNGTPDLRDKFVICADADSGGTYNVGDNAADTLIHGHTQDAHDHELLDTGSPVLAAGSDIPHRSSPTNPTNAGSTSIEAIHPPYYALAYIMKT